MKVAKLIGVIKFSNLVNIIDEDEAMIYKGEWGDVPLWLNNYEVLEISPIYEDGYLKLVIMVIEQ